MLSNRPILATYQFVQRLPKHTNLVILMGNRLVCLEAGARGRLAARYSAMSASPDVRLLHLQMNSTFGVDATDFIDKWVAQRARDASALGKPLVIEEFGKQLEDFSAANIAAVRNPVFQAIYDSLQDLEIVKGMPVYDTQYLG